MLSQDQLSAFTTDGFVRLPGAVPADHVHDMRQRLWSLLEQRGALRDDPSTWQAAATTRLHAIRLGDPDPKASDAVRNALDVVFAGQDWHTRADWGQALVTFPNAERWTVPTRIWHLDHPFKRPQMERISGVNVLLFADDVEPGGGGTPVVRSSPALIDGFMTDVPEAETLSQTELGRRFFRSHPWFAELKGKPQRSDRNERFLSDRDVAGVAARVVELTGKAGDVVLCHPWLIHAAGAPNATQRPRLMRASRIYRSRGTAE